MFLNIIHTGMIVSDEFVVTSQRQGVTTCEGCAGYLDSFSASSSTQQRACCVHTMTLPSVLAINSGGSSTLTTQSTFLEYVATELDSTESTILLKKWSHYLRYLVFISPRLALSEKASRFSVCSLSGKDDCHNRRLFCDSVRCKRGTNKKISKKKQPNVCCHLKQLLESVVINADSEDTFTCAATEEVTSDSGKQAISYVNMQSLNVYEIRR